jgi:glucose/mannose-6-phosphate isomerase
MSILKHPDQWASIDSRSMHSLLEAFPEQLEAAAKAGREISVEKTGDIRLLIVTGLGGSAIGGDLVRSIAGPQLRIPLVVNRDYDLPGFVDARTMVFACSYSGNTEETLSAYRQACRAKSAIVCITSGGRLGEMAKSDGYPVIPLPAGLPPRAALGHSLLSLLSAMQALHFIPDMGEPVGEAIGLIKRLRENYGSANPEPSNPAMALAGSLHGKIVAVYASSQIMDGAAFRWRSQIAENSKNLAFHHVLPEMNHNELVGWWYPEEVLKKVGVVFLRDKGDHAQIQRRFDLTRELIADKAGALHEVWSEGNSLPARVLSVVYLGDFVSLYLAYLNNVDPTPVKVIDYLKQKLAGSG